MSKDTKYDPLITVQVHCQPLPLPDLPIPSEPYTIHGFLDLSQKPKPKKAQEKKKKSATN